MNKIRQWPESEDMSHYARLVACSDGDVDVLHELTDDAKSEPGIASLGCRTSLLSLHRQEETLPLSVIDWNGRSGCSSYSR